MPSKIPLTSIRLHPSIKAAATKLVASRPGWTLNGLVNDALYRVVQAITGESIIIEAPQRKPRSTAKAKEVARRKK